MPPFPPPPGAHVYMTMMSRKVEQRALAVNLQLNYTTSMRSDIVSATNQQFGDRSILNVSSQNLAIKYEPISLTTAHSTSSDDTSNRTSPSKSWI